MLGTGILARANELPPSMVMLKPLTATPDSKVLLVTVRV